MVTRNTIAADVVTAKTPGSDISYPQQAKYVQMYDYTELEETALVPLNVLYQLMPVVVSVEAIDIPIGSIINSDGFVEVSYTGYETHGNLPDYWVNRFETGYKTKFYPDTRVYPNTGTPTSIWVYLADVDDGTGHTSNHNELVIK